MVTHSSTLAWKSPWTEEPGRLQSMGSQSQTWLSDFTHTHTHTHTHIYIYIEREREKERERQFFINICLSLCMHAQTCPTFWDPVDFSPSDFLVHGIIQARILKWVSLTFYRGSSWPSDETQVSCLEGRFFTIWATRETHDFPLCSVLVAQFCPALCYRTDIACQAPLSMGFSRQEYSSE